MHLVLRDILETFEFCTFISYILEHYTMYISQPGPFKMCLIIVTRIRLAMHAFTERNDISDQSDRIVTNYQL